MHKCFVNKVVEIGNALCSYFGLSTVRLAIYEMDYLCTSEVY